MEECIFCRIVRGEIDSVKIWEDEDFFAFLDTSPREKGHTLIIPKKHFDDLMSLDEEISKKYVAAIQKVGKILMKKYNSKGFNVVLNNGKAAGQIVGHIHFHLLPRKEGDNKRGIFLG